MSGQSSPDLLAEATRKKLEAEALKIAAEAVDVGRHPFSRPGTWMPLLLAVGTAIGGLITAYYSFQVREIEVSAARLDSERALIEADRRKLALEQAAAELDRRVTDLQRNEDRLRSEIGRLQQEREQTSAEIARIRGEVEAAERRLASIAAAPDPVAAATAIGEGLGRTAAQITGLAATLERQSGRVFLHFRGALDRSVMRNLETRLEAAGYTVPGIERVAGDWSSSVRYFHDEDAELARDVAGMVTEFFTGVCALPAPIATSRLTLRAPRGQIEVWVSQNCGPAR